MQKTCSLETAKKLVEAGIILNTEEAWRKQFEGYALKEMKEIYKDIGLFYPAPDIAELLEALPNSIELKDLKIIKSNYLETNPISTMFWVGYWDKDGSIISYRNKELPEALAQLLLWVKTQEGVK